MHFEMHSCQILEIEDGRIVRFRIYQDTVQMDLGRKYTIQ